MLLDLLSIAVISVIIIDISGFIESVNAFLRKWLKGPYTVPRPFSCSLCMTFWCSLIYLIATSSITLDTIALSLFISIMTPVIYSGIILIRDVMDRLLYIIATFFRL